MRLFGSLLSIGIQPLLFHSNAGSIHLDLFLTHHNRSLARGGLKSNALLSSYEFLCCVNEPVLLLSFGFENQAGSVPFPSQQAHEVLLLGLTPGSFLS
jgi:hypothetical protein